MSVIPKKFPVTSEIIPLSGYRKLLAVDKATDTLYIGNGYDLEKTADWDATTETVHTFTSRVDHVEVLDDGALLVGLLGGRVYRYIDGTATEVLAMKSLPLHGFNVVGNIITVGEYAYPPTKIWLSTDYGATWDPILEVTDPYVDHCHDVVFDPYENIIWSCWGDDRPYDTILYSDDFGASWQQIAEKYYLRATNIMPLPNCVLFGTDQYNVLGTYRHDRPANGTVQSDVRPYLDWLGRKDTFTDTTIWAMKPAMTYGPQGDALALWGYRLPANNGVVPAQVYASDGVLTRPIWSQNKISDGPEANGIYRVFGPTDSGYIVADLRSVYPDSEGVDCTQHIVKIAWNVSEA